MAAVIGCGGWLGASSPSHAAAPGWLRNAFTARLHGPKGPQVARYEIDSGGDFILDRSSAQPLIKFEDNPEVFALKVSRGPRGDLLYWNDMRQPLLRVTKFGGVTVFTNRRPEGAAASLAGQAPPLRLQSIGPVGLTQHLMVASTRSGRSAGRPVLYEAPDADAGDDALIADAAMIVSEAMVELAARPGGRALVGRINRVALERGREPAVGVRDSTLFVSVSPAMGLAGRPSSLRVQQALGARAVGVSFGLSP